MIREIQPYLYCTVEMVWWVWTVCASEWINEDNANVLRALTKDAGFEWQDDSNHYEVFAKDKENKVRFRLRKNPDYVQGKDGPNQVAGDGQLIDLQYVTVLGTVDAISKRIAQYTSPPLDAPEIEAIIKQLKSHMHKPDRPGYVPQPKATFERWHKYTTLPSPYEPNGKKLLQTSESSMCPERYIKGFSDPTKQMRTENDVEREDENKQYPVIDDSDLRKHDMLHFIPTALGDFNPNIIQAALFSATICHSTRPGKYLLGFPDMQDLTRLTVTKLEKSDILNFVEKEDVANGFKMVGGKPVFIDQTVPINERPVSRRIGIPFNNGNALAPEEQDCVTAQNWAPKAEGDESWRDKYDDAAESMSNPIEIVSDLNAHSARKQHMRCGRPLTEPVRTPAWIQEQYENACKKMGVPWHIGLDYPLDNKECRDRLDSQWKKSSGSIKQVARVKQDVAKCNTLKPRDKRLEQEANRMQDKRRNKRSKT